MFLMTIEGHRPVGPVTNTSPTCPSARVHDKNAALTRFAHGRPRSWHWTTGRRLSNERGNTGAGPPWFLNWLFLGAVAPSTTLLLDKLT
jgi:hypothetical protein